MNTHPTPYLSTADYAAVLAIAVIAAIVLIVMSKTGVIKVDIRLWWRK